MKKTFVVEVEYEEKKENVEDNADVFYDYALEHNVEELMYEYLKTNSIKSFSSVKVKQVENSKQK